MKKEINLSDEIVRDGKLTRDEALNGLKDAAVSANNALPKALAKCNTPAEREKVQTDRNITVLSYLRAQRKSLEKTGPLFEKMADNLKKEAANVRQKTEELKEAVEAIKLLEELARLAAVLALAFA